MVKPKLTFKDVSKLFQKCHDEIWCGGKNDPAFAFDEFSKLLIVKMLSEKINKNQEIIFTTPQQIKKFYSNWAKKRNNIFDSEINLTNNIIVKIIKLFENIEIYDIDLDIKGQALEDFLGKTFRDEYGQYFTPRPIVNFCVSALNPSKVDSIMDPTCGSGGFLIYSLKHLNKKYRQIDISKSLYGIEINKRIARIAMIEMLINEDGSSNILCDNSLSFNHTKKYSMIFTNPPFGVTITDKKILDNYELQKHGKSEVLFIEKCHDILQNNGKMCIVLPDSVLTNSTLQFVRDYIKDKFQILGIISLPHHTFIHSGAGVKSSLLFLKKTKPSKRYKIFTSIVNHIGYDERQNEDENELPIVLSNWINNKKTKQSFFINVDQLTDSFTPSLNHLLKGVELGSVCEVFTGSSPASTDYEKDGKKILKVRDLTGKGIKWDVTSRGYVGDKYKSKKYIQKKDILIISSAHHPKYIGLKVDIVDFIPDKYKSVFCTTEVMVIRPNPEKIEPYKLFCFLKSTIGYDAIQSCIRGQTSHIYPKDISKIIMPKIKINEKKINLLQKTMLQKSKLDYQIHQQQKELFLRGGEL